MIYLKIKSCEFFVNSWGKNIGVLLLLCFGIPFVFGFSASTNSYSVDSYHTGLSGNEPTTANYSSRSTTVYQQGGNLNVTTSSYSFNSGWSETQDITSEEEEVVDDTTTTTGGGGGGVGVECYVSSDCNDNKYCFDNVCYEAQCFDDSVCNVVDGEVCWDLRCVKLFDVKIIEFESPIILGDFFDFTYFVKGVANINGDVTINFRIEQDGSVVTSGYDVVYFGSFEEKTETTSLFLPRNVKSGTYEFIIEVNLGTYTAQSSRIVEISVEGGIATLQLFDISFSLEDRVIESSDELVGIATFENFGNVPTPVDLTFIILNENENEVHRVKDTITVETEEILRKSFNGLDLPRGKYTLVLQTLYNVNVADEFKQDFEIRSSLRVYLNYGLIGIGILVIIFIIVLITWLVLRRKPTVRAQIGRSVSDRIRLAKVAIRAIRTGKEYDKLQRIKEREVIWRQKLRDKLGKEKIRNSRMREKENLAKERLKLKDISKRKEENKRTIMDRILGREKVLIAKKKLVNEEVAWRVALERKKFSEEKRLSNRKVKEGISGNKEKEKLERDKMKESEVAKKIKNFEKKKALLQKGYETGYINKKAYNIDMKKINKLISGLKR